MKRNALKTAGVVLGGADSTRLFRQLAAKQGRETLDYDLFLTQLHEKALETYDAKMLDREHVLPTRAEASAQMRIVRDMQEKGVEKGQLWDSMLAKGSTDERARGSVSFSQFIEGMRENGIDASDIEIRQLFEKMDGGGEGRVHFSNFRWHLGDDFHISFRRNSDPVFQDDYLYKRRKRHCESSSAKDNHGSERRLSTNESRLFHRYRCPSLFCCICINQITARIATFSAINCRTSRPVDRSFA